VAHGVDRLPGDEHGHDGGLARARSQLQGETHQLGIGVGVGLLQMFEEALARLAELRRDFGQPDCCLRGFDLTEEGADA
jgi:hypothetical protein